MLGEEAIELLPERGDHERSTFPELAAEGRLRAYRHEGAWLTVNTPKELRAAEEHVAAHPELAGGDVSGYAFETRRVEKPWGRELHFALTDRYCGKILVVRAGEALSLQYHERKDETLHLHAGRAPARARARSADALDGVELAPGDSIRLPPGTVHRLVALEDCVILEASTPELDDVVRLDDRYGRAGAR